MRSLPAKSVQPPKRVLSSNRNLDPRHAASDSGTDRIPSMHEVFVLKTKVEYAVVLTQKCMFPTSNLSVSRSTLCFQSPTSWHLVR